MLNSGQSWQLFQLLAVNHSTKAASAVTESCLMCPMQMSHCSLNNTHSCSVTNFPVGFVCACYYECCTGKKMLWFRIIQLLEYLCDLGTMCKGIGVDWWDAELINFLSFHIDALTHTHTHSKWNFSPTAIDVSNHLFDLEAIQKSVTKKMHMSTQKQDRMTRVQIEILCQQHRMHKNEWSC